MSTMFLSPGQVPLPAPNAPMKEPWRENLNSKLICKECLEDPPNIVEEFSSGDCVCGSCGLVLGDRIVDTRSEWRTFSNDESGHDDPSRVGGASNPLFDGDQLQTSISFNDGGLRARELARAQSKMNNDKSKKGLSDSYSLISAYGSGGKLSLDPSTIEIAHHLYKMVNDSGHFKSKNNDTIVAGCIFIACRQAAVPRTFKEISAATKVSKKEIGRMFKLLKAFFSAEKNKKGKATISSGVVLPPPEFNEKETHNAVSLCDRYCNRLKLSNSVGVLAKALAEKTTSTGALAGRSPLSAASACIYMASALLGDARTPREIGAVAGVSDGTIRTSYKLLLAEKDSLIDPEWLSEAKGGKMSRLPTG